MNKIIWDTGETSRNYAEHLFQRKFTDEEVDEAGGLMHLTKSDMERAFKLEKRFGEVKCKECNQTMRDYEVKETFRCQKGKCQNPAYMSYSLCKKHLLWNRLFSKETNRRQDKQEPRTHKRDI